MPVIRAVTEKHGWDEHTATASWDSGERFPGELTCKLSLRLYRTCQAKAVKGHKCF